jgi:phosphate acetyltransferase
MSDLFTSLIDKVSGKEAKIVFPEGTDERILTAASVWWNFGTYFNWQ